MKNSKLWKRCVALSMSAVMMLSSAEAYAQEIQPAEVQEAEAELVESEDVQTDSKESVNALNRETDAEFLDSEEDAEKSDGTAEGEEALEVQETDLDQNMELPTLTEDALPNDSVSGNSEVQEETDAEEASVQTGQQEMLSDPEAKVEETPSSEEAGNPMQTDSAEEAEQGMLLPASGAVTAYRAATPDLVISNVDQLKEFFKNVTDGETYNDKLVKLGADIRLDGMTVNNIALANGTFNGTFDGNGHTISGIVVIEDDAYGLFKTVGESGVIKNLTVSNSEMTLGREGSVGIIAGDNKGGIYNCAVIDSKIENGNYCGGISGYNYGVVDRCQNIGTSVKNSSYSAIAGGIVGGNWGTIQNSLNTGTIAGSGRGDWRNDSYYDGYYDYYQVGGICGYSAGGFINNCGNMGEIKGEYGCGGIVGYAANGATIQNSYNSGSLSSESDSYGTGGLVGKAGYDTIISYCYYANTAVKDIDDKDSSVIIRNNAAMDLASMKGAEFVNRLNTNSAANSDWVPWEIRAGLAYPQHVPVYAVELGKTSYGTVEVDTSYGYQGRKVTITVTPDAYYRLSVISVKTASGTAISCTGSGKVYSFTMPNASVTIEVSFVYSKPIKECSVSLSSTSYTYDGSQKTPGITVKDGMKTLQAGTDYTYVYSANVNAGTANVTVTGKGNYTGSTAASFTIAKAPQQLTSAAASYRKTDGNAAFSLGARCGAGPKKVTYQSSAPAVASVNGDGKVTLKGPGYAKITITAPGDANYQTETKAVEVHVNPKQQKVKKLRTKSGRKLLVQWTRDSKATGYVVQYSTDKNYWSNNTVYNNKTTSLTLEFSSYSVNKKYYVRVCSYKNTDSAGTYYGEYSPVVKSAKIQEKVTPQIANCSISLSKTSYTYDGKAKKPSVTVKYGSAKLKKGTDYTVTYSSNKKVGTAKVTIKGKGKYKGSVTKSFKIVKAKSNGKKGTQKISSPQILIKAYGSKPFSLKAKRTQGNGKLTYKSSNKKVASVNSKGKVMIKGTGTATITVTAKGTSSYRAKSVKTKIYVKPKKGTVTGLKAVKGKKLTISWKKDNKASGYEIQYSTDRSFKNNVQTKRIAKSGTTRLTAKGLARGKVYYVRVRAYKNIKVSGKIQRLYGSYSKVRTSARIKK